MQNATISLYVTLLPPNSHSEPACPRHAGTANISQQGFARITTEPRRIYAAALRFSGRAFSSEAIILLNQFNTADSSSSSVLVR